MSGRPILVTGAHRSGTTWVGRMLSFAPGVAYVHEPFSPATRPGISSAPFTRYYERVTAANEALYAPGLERTVARDYAWGAELRTLRTPKDAARAVRDACRFARMKNDRLLIKDPIALVSADWFAERFGMDVVVTIRHPAAFAASVIRLGWRHDVSTFRGDERLARFQSELHDEPDALVHAALLWRVLYSLVDDYRRQHPDWHFLRHEDASRRPLETFASLYEQLGLELDERAEREIVRNTSSENPDVPPSTHAIGVNSAANVQRWKSQLDPDDVARLRELTADVWPRFYSPDDW